MPPKSAEQKAKQLLIKKNNDAQNDEDNAKQRVVDVENNALAKQLSSAFGDAFYLFLYMTLLYVLLSCISHRSKKAGLPEGSKMVILIIIFSIGFGTICFYKYQKKLSLTTKSDFKYSLLLLFIIISIICAWNYKKNEGGKYLLDINDGFEPNSSIEVDIAKSFIKVNSSTPEASLDKFVIGGIIIQLIVITTIDISGKHANYTFSDARDSLDAAADDLKDVGEESS
jgi:hypothetical protein